MPPEYDVVVIGAGINGAAIARDAALRGYRVLVLEQGDLCCGTSSWSSRLIYGGLRYLEYGELPLVYESLHERRRLLRLAPHLVRPLALTIPIYATGQRPRWKIRLGLWLYDRLAGRHSLEHHRMLSAHELRRRVPGVNAQDLVGGACYYDAQIRYPERLVVEQIADAVQQGATLKTRARAEQVLVERGEVRGVRFRRADGRGSVAASTRTVINAAGPWLDDLLQGIVEQPLLGGTKGSHIIVPAFPGAPSSGFYSEAVSDGRPFFILPWNDLFLIGTTDIRYQGDPADVRISSAEVSYLLNETAHVFPDARLSPADIAYCYAGVRPLPDRPVGDEGAITRRHIIKHHNPAARGLFSVIGGKLTTHRNLAEQAVDKVQRLLGGGRPCVTRSRPLPGAANDQTREEFLGAAGAQLSAVQAEHLWAVYGQRAASVLTTMAGDGELARVICPFSQASAGELVYALDQEWAVDLIDLLQRRTMAGLSRDFGLRAAVNACQSLTRAGVWNAQRAAAELSAYRDYADRFRPPAASVP